MFESKLLFVTVTFHHRNSYYAVIFNLCDLCHMLALLGLPGQEQFMAWDMHFCSSVMIQRDVYVTL